MRRVWGTFVEGLEHRMDLFSIELKDANVRHVRIMLPLYLAVSALFIAFLALNTLLIIAFWDHRVIVTASLLAFYAIAGAALLWRVFIDVRDAPPPFGATMGELRKDYESWRAEQ